MMTRAFKGRFSKLASSEQGSVFILVALAATMLIISTGVAVDMARAQVLQAKIQTALDAAGLAAGATASTGPSTLPSYCGTAPTWVQCQANKYFFANFPTGYLNSGTVTVTATLSGINNSTVTLTANTTQATAFMKIVGISSVNVGANSQITRASSGMELVLVLDNTGSMATVLPNDSLEKIQALKNAITGSGQLLDQIYGASNDTIPNLWVGVVPFTDMVNIGPGGYSGWMDTTFDGTLDVGPVVSGSSCPASTVTSPSTSGSYSSSPNRCSYTMSGTKVPNFGLTSNWAGCVLARTSPYEGSNADQIPSSSVTGSLFQAYVYPTTSSGSSQISNNKCTGGSNDWYCTKHTSSGNTQQTIYEAATYSSLGIPTFGPNLNCPITPVLPMVASKASVISTVDTMQANGSTMINLGMAWGYRMLSPNFAGLWTGGNMYSTGNVTYPQLPLPYHTVLMNKVLILMTDGMNSAPGSAKGSAYQNQTLPTNAQLDTTTEQSCDAMKANGIIIYTIGFGTTDDNNPSNPTSVDGPLLKYCATQNYTGDTSHYFLATNSTSLSGVFTEIGAQLSNLRVSQ